MAKVLTVKVTKVLMAKAKVLTAKVLIAKVLMAKVLIAKVLMAKVLMAKVLPMMDLVGWDHCVVSFSWPSGAHGSNHRRLRHYRSLYQSLQISVAWCKCSSTLRTSCP